MTIATPPHPLADAGLDAAAPAFDAAMERRFLRQRDALLTLARHGTSADGVDDTLRLASELISGTLEVERAGVWLFSEASGVLRCADQFVRTPGEHTRGEELRPSDAPRYFRAIAGDRAIAADDAHSDPRTSEFLDSYLLPNGVTSMLDATVRRGGEMVGVVCAEHVGPARRWTVDECTFAASVADLVAVALEMAERRRVERALRESDERYRAFIRLSGEGIWRIEMHPPIPVDLPLPEQAERVARDGLFAECNDAYARMNGLDDPERIVGRPLSALMRHELLVSLAMRTLGNGYRGNGLEYARPDANGRQRWFVTNITAIVENGLLTSAWGIQREVTERREYVAALEHQATHDALTDLPNRHALALRLDEAIRDGAEAALLLIDLDRFKEVNDAISHEAGDALLRLVGGRLRAAADAVGAGVARLGGDEFAVLLPGVADPEGVNAAARRLLDAISAPFQLEGIALEVAASIGVALHPLHAQGAAELLRRADVAMYRAKREGRGVAFYDAERDPHSARRLTLMAELGSAIRERRLFLHYQPKVSLAGRRLLGFEALVRWRHPVHGVIPPGDFIPWAETSELIRPLTLAVLDEAARQWRAWADAGLAAGMAVNLSPRNLLDDELPAALERVMGDYAVPPETLSLEITESSVISDPGRAYTNLRRAADMGVRLAMDDFGTGYSSLTYLRRLPLDELKIDLSFVSGMLSSDSDHAIVRSTIGLAHHLGLTVTAEGVEDEPTLRALADLGCDHAQGFHIARPMAADDVPGWLAAAPW
ncbi:MAG TPA: EAL domain-containing protein [Longimicrobium sp.]|nr:EAL domain-containing protein [Longimicrobium sp.]